MITKSLFVENFDLIESARDLLRIRSRFSTLDDAFRDDALVLKCLMELTDCDKKRFILYSERSGTEYRIDADEVIKMMDNPDVELSSRAKAEIDRLLVAAFAM